MAKTRKHIVFYGQVQGVGFRYRAYYAAKEWGLTGWVQNLYDGTVEMEAQGEESAIRGMVDTLKRQRYIRIDHAEMEARPLEKENSFRILG